MKTHDLSVKVGEYMMEDGTQKARWANVGAIVKNDKGSVILLNRYFNPAGVPGEDGENILIQMFPADRDRQPRKSAVDFSDTPF